MRSQGHCTIIGDRAFVMALTKAIYSEPGVGGILLEQTNPDEPATSRPWAELCANRRKETGACMSRLVLGVACSVVCHNRDHIVGRGDPKARRFTVRERYRSRCSHARG